MPKENTFYNVKRFSKASFTKFFDTVDFFLFRFLNILHCEDDVANLSRRDLSTKTTTEGPYKAEDRSSDPQTLTIDSARVVVSIRGASNTPDVLLHFGYPHCKSLQRFNLASGVPLVLWKVCVGVDVATVYRYTIGLPPSLCFGD